MADGEDPGHGTREEDPKFVQKDRARKAAGGDDPVAQQQPVRTGDARLNEILEQLERDKPRLEAERRRREWFEQQTQERIRIQQEGEERDFLEGRMTTVHPPPPGVRLVYPWFYEQVKARVEAKERQDPQGGRRRRKTRKHRKSRRTRKHSRR